MKLKTTQDNDELRDVSDTRDTRQAGDGRDARQLVSGVPVDSAPHEVVLEDMDRAIRAGDEPRWICITNTESMYYAVRKGEHLDFIRRSRWSLCDGMGVVIAGRFWGHRVRRFNGPVLMLKACDYGRRSGWRHYFCGGREGVADALSENLQRQFPGMVVAGTYCPPFRQLSDEETDAMVAAINASRPDVVWVGLGLLKQEAWIARFAPRLHCRWLVGVGAAFDYHAGTARWAPAWIRAIGLEWLYRLCFEPRMFVRLVRSFHFMFASMGQGVVARLRGAR